MTSAGAITFTIVGAGRAGNAFAHALREAGAAVQGPLRRDASLPAAGVVLLCVPEGALPGASATIPAGCIVGHCSASAPLDLLSPHERFVAHPLLPLTKATTSFAGAVCAVDGNTSRAFEIAQHLASLLHMRAVNIPTHQRALYHAAGSMAANFLVTLEASAERLALPTGIQRSDLATIVRASVENWLALGGKDALTGPVSRNEIATVANQRRAVAAAAPDLLPLWDALVAATRKLAELD
ncbi:MAG: DUF2520 domain-containing protein [Gemmatimonadota bacterium]|nr:DUF2520 domain-containing protein [Gemmatimonadota bacterium]